MLPSVVDIVYTSPGVNPVWLNVSTVVPSPPSIPLGPVNVPPATVGRTAMPSTAHIVLDDVVLNCNCNRPEAFGVTVNVSFTYTPAAVLTFVTFAPPLTTVPYPVGNVTVAFAA